MNLATPLHEPVIVYVATADLSLPIGPSVNEREFWLALSRSGEEAIAILPQPAREIEELRGTNVRWFERSRRKLVGMLWRDQRRLLQGARAVLAEIRSQGRTPIVVCRMPFMPWAINDLMAEFPDIPFFFKSVGDTEFLRRSKGARRLLSRPLWPLQSALVRRALSISSGFDTPTSLLKAYLCERYGVSPDKALMLSNATNAERFDPAAVTPAELPFEPDSIVLGYVGGHPFVRGGCQIIRVLADLASTHPHLRCIIAGGDAEPLWSLARELRVAERCHIPGKVPYDDVPALLARVDLMIATDDSARSAELGNSNQKIRQALAMGIPVITNPACEAALVENGLVIAVDTDDAEALAMAVKDFAGWPEAARKAFAIKSRAFVVANMSTTSALRSRLAFWRERSQPTHLSSE